MKTITLRVKGQFGDSIKYSVCHDCHGKEQYCTLWGASLLETQEEWKIFGSVRFKYLLDTSCNIIFIHDINSRNLAVSLYQQPMHFLVFLWLCSVNSAPACLDFSHFQDEKQEISLLWPKEEAPQWTFKKTYLVYYGITDATEMTCMVCMSVRVCNSHMVSIPSIWIGWHRQSAVNFT